MKALLKHGKSSWPYWVVGFVLVVFSLLPSCAPYTNASAWHNQLRGEIKALGYKNWIVVADSSFPYYNRPGVRTLTAAAPTPEVIDRVVQSIDEVQHVKPQFYTARELRAVSNTQSPGIGLYRKSLEEALHGYEPRELDQKTLMRLLDSTSSHFAVLVIKTQTSHPYSSVFIELDSGYWDGDLERELRKTMQEAVNKQEPPPAAPSAASAERETV